MIRVLVWNEFRHEKSSDRVKEVYPDGIHSVIAEFLGKEEDIEVKTAWLDQENCGITKEILDETDVIIWWGHKAHNEVPDEIASLVRDAVLDGMGAIFLHSVISMRSRFSSILHTPRETVPFALSVFLRR